MTTTALTRSSPSRAECFCPFDDRGERERERGGGGGGGNAEEIVDRLNQLNAMSFTFLFYLPSLRLVIFIFSIRLGGEGNNLRVFS